VLHHNTTHTLHSLALTPPQPAYPPAEALHNIYGDRHYAYFHALETIARVPYFAYTSVLHLYETLGWSRRADLMKIHFAESWNEQHHLLIMEALGGHERYVDRLISQHLAFAYFFIASSLYVLYPAMAYNLNEQVRALLPTSPTPDHINSRGPGSSML
jgi:hypothetical protein